MPELLGLRSSSLASEHIAALPVNSPHVIAKTGAGAAASSDVTLKFSGNNHTAKTHTLARCMELCVLMMCWGLYIHLQALKPRIRPAPPSAPVSLAMARRARA